MPRHFIDEIDDQLAFERMESFGGGMDAFTPATLIAPNAYVYSENILVPDNLRPRTRPGADTLGSTRGARIQGLIYFDTPSTEQLLAGAGTKIYAWGGSSWTEATGWTLNDADLNFAAAQGIDTVLFSDGVQQMRTWNGAAWSSALGSTPGDPPVGATILCWHAGRMFAAGFPGSVAGKENDAIWVSTRLAYGSGNWDGVARQFRVGGGEGDPILALASMQNFKLVVGKENSIWIVTADPTAEPANFSASVAGDKLTDGLGICGRRAGCVYGNDFLFMARRVGVHSVQRMIAAAGQYQLSAPLSEPIQPYIDRINWSFAHLIAAKKYKELALFSVPLDSSTVPNTVLVWNGRLGKWTGIWTGWTANSFEVTRFSGVNRLVYGDNTGLVRQWKDFSDAADDNTYLEDGAVIPTKLWTRSVLFGEPINNKSAYHAEVRFGVSNALVNVTAVADSADLKLWTVDARQKGVDLPIAELPFDLADPSTVAARKGLRGTKPFNEVYLKLESSSGWWQLWNVSLSAFINMLANR